MTRHFAPGTRIDSFEPPVFRGRSSAETMWISTANNASAARMFEEKNPFHCSSPFVRTQPNVAVNPLLYSQPAAVRKDDLLSAESGNVFSDHRSRRIPLKSKGSVITLIQCLACVECHCWFAQQCETVARRGIQTSYQRPSPIPP